MDQQAPIFQPPPSMRTIKRSPIIMQIVIFTLGRTILNTGSRMFYPFLPFFSRALNVDVSLIALAISIRAWLGLAGPLIGPLADMRGLKVSMLLGMGIFSGGFGMVALWPTFPSLFVALLLGTISKILLDPAVQAFLGDHVDYSKRGTTIAITELAWSGAYILGIPIVGFLMENWDWQAPFLWLACMGDRCRTPDICNCSPGHRFDLHLLIERQLEESDLASIRSRWNLDRDVHYRGE
jgi:predicted MFS family arabinose efflux permease